MAQSSQPEVVGWPLPTCLLEELTRWRQFPGTSLWCEATENAFQRLNNLRIDDPASAAMIDYLKLLADQLGEYARALPPTEYELSSRLSHLEYSMRRRIDVWRAVHQVAIGSSATPQGMNRNTAFQVIRHHTASVDVSSISPAWVGYLMLEEAREAFADGQPNTDWSAATARRILARISSSSLTGQQASYARKIIGEELGTALRNAATDRLNPGELLTDLEAFEQGRSSAADARVNAHFQNCYWSWSPEMRTLSEVLESHYRNANIRVEFSDRLINRVVPRNVTLNQPVQDRILGAHVFGQSRIHNQLGVELIPDNSHLSFRLQSQGNVQSRTRAHASGFVFNSLGNAMVNSSKGVSIGTDGVTILPTNVVAESREKLLGINSRLDSFPVVGLIARRVAEQQQQAQSPQANQIVEQKLRSEFGNRIDQEIQQRVTSARQWIDDRILDPLRAMELEPAPIALQTTASSAIIRYRLAGLDQNAARTVRPEGLPGSLLNAQIHESAVNNLLDRIHINGNTFTAPEFQQHIAELLGRPDLMPATAENADVKFQFAPRNALGINFDDSRVAITLKLKRLQIDKTGLWKNLIVTAWYKPQAQGLRVKMFLDMERGISLQGHRLSITDELAIRTLFNTLFKTEFEFPLLPADLASRPLAREVAVSQIVLAEGWLGLSVSELPARAPTRETPAAAERQAWQGFRSSRWR